MRIAPIGSEPVEEVFWCPWCLMLKSVEVRHFRVLLSVAGLRRVSQWHLFDASLVPTPLELEDCADVQAAAEGTTDLLHQD